MKKIIVFLVSLTCTFSVFSKTLQCNVQDFVTGERITVPVVLNNIYTPEGVDFKGSHFSAVSWPKTIVYTDPPIPCLTMTIDDISTNIYNVNDSSQYGMFKENSTFQFYCSFK